MPSSTPGAGLLSDAARRVKHPLALLVLIAVVIRLVVMPLLSHDFDIYHWALVIQNIQTGDQLYDMDGYYYTPTWGFILGFVSFIQDTFLNVDVFGDRITGLLPIEDLVFDDHMATATSIAFNMSVKAPLVIVDVVVGWLLYRLVQELTGSDRKAIWAAALWLLCPVAVFMSGIQAQFDGISALLVLLIVILLRRDHCFLSGMLLTSAILLKFFPAFAIFVLIGYVYVKHRDDGTAIRRLVTAAIGMAVMFLVLYMPTIAGGEFMDSLFFMTGRVETQTSSGALYTIGSWLLIAIGLAGMFWSGYRMFRTGKENADSGLFSNMLVSLTCAMFVSIMPQYILVVMPVLIIVMLTSDGRMRLAWILMCAGAMVTVIASNNIMLLDTLSAFTGLVSADWIVDVAYALESVTIGPWTLVTFLGALGIVIECLGLLFILILNLEGPIGAKLPRLGDALRNVRRWDFDE